mgnify:CR=1 FL=1
MKALIRMEDEWTQDLSLSALVAKMWQLTPTEVALSLKEASDEPKLNEQQTFDVCPALFKFKNIASDPLWQQFPAKREYSSVYMAPLQRYRRLQITTPFCAETVMQVRAYAVLILEVAQATHGKISEDEGQSWQSISEFESKYRSLLDAPREVLQRFSALEGDTLSLDETGFSKFSYLY